MTRYKHRFDSYIFDHFGPLVEPADTLLSKSSAARHISSTLIGATILKSFDFAVARV